MAMIEYGLFGNLKAKLIKCRTFPSITIKEGETVNPRLLGMSNEELIQWACEHGNISQRNME